MADAPRGALALLALGLAARLALGIQWIPRVAGPFRIVPEHVLECPPELAPTRVCLSKNITLRRNRERADVFYYNGNVRTHCTFDENITAVGTTAVWKSTGGWAERHYSVRVPHLCTFLPTVFGVYWRMFMKHFFNDPDRKCPIRPDTFTFRNFSSDFNFTVPPAVHYGRYRSTFQFFSETTKEVVACFRMSYAAVPKVDHHRG